MIAFSPDLFEFWRMVLWITCLTYSCIMIARTAYSWCSLLYAPGRQSRLLRRYVQFQLLRVRLLPLRRELALTAFYAVVLAVLLLLHGTV